MHSLLATTPYKNVTFRKMLESEREKRGLRYKEFADFLGVNKCSLVNWESLDVLPRVDAAVHVCKKLNVNLYDLDLPYTPRNI